MSEERVSELAEEFAINDADMRAVYRRVANALTDSFDKCDSGMGQGWCDFWVQHEGVEYKLVMKPHRSIKATS